MAQLWEFSAITGAYCITGSTFGVYGKILSANLVKGAGTAIGTEAQGFASSAHTSKHKSPALVLLQVVKRDDIQLEIHQLNKKPSFVQSLVLPAASSGPGPYTVYTTHSDKCLAIIAKTGAITLFSVPEFLVLPLSGLETNFNSHGQPLFDISGRWLVYSPVSPIVPGTSTPLKLPEPGLLLDRILDNISSTTAGSLKLLSDAGVAGIKHYLSKDQQPNKKAKHTDNVIYVGHNRFNVDSSGRVGQVKGSSLPLALSSLFYTQSTPRPIQVIDLETQTTVSTFISPQGLSFLSLSPYDAVLATVSARGDCVFTFDLSFVPRQVTLSGKYVRGKTPGKVSRVEWDATGGFGIVTLDKGSVHWFERQPWNIYESQVGTGVSIGGASVAPPSVTNANKLWRLSGWNVSNVCVAPDYIGSEPEYKNKGDIPLISPEPSPFSPASVSSALSHSSVASAKASKVNKILMLRKGEILVVDRSTGNCTWKYELPATSVQEHLLAPVLSIVEDSKTDSESECSEPEITLQHRELSPIEPLSFYEVETFLPCAFIHTDRHVTLSTYDGNGDSYEDGLVFGKVIKANDLDFGRARGQVNFEATELEDEWGVEDGDCGGLLGEGDADALFDEIPPEKAKELRLAMESMVIDR